MAICEDHGHYYEITRCPKCRDEAERAPCPSCAEKDAEIKRLRGIAENEKGLLDIIKRQDTELTRLRAEVERAGDVGTIARIMSSDGIRQKESADYTGNINLIDTARAVSAWIKEGR